jgi:vitamin B12 transporter
MSTKKLPLKQLPLVIAAILSAPLFAATEEVVVTGTYSPVTGEQLNSSVTVVDREELLALSSHSLVDALRQVPSLWVEEQGGPGGITAIALRGAESNHTLVLLDGVQLNDPTNTRGGAFDLNNINIDSIKRIEIIRGAQSAIYGPDALAGVIHIITLEPTDKFQHQLSATTGEDGYKTGSFASSGKIDNFGYAFKLQSKDAGEPITGSTAENKEALAKLSWEKDAHHLDFSYRYFDGEKTSFPEQSGGPLFAQSRDLDESEFTDQNAALAWLYQVNDHWRSKIQASWFNREEDAFSPGIIPYNNVPPNGAATDFTRDAFSWTNTLGDEKSFWTNLGVETKHEDGVSKGYILGFDMPLDFSLERRINSAFINFNNYINPDLLIQASVRRDDVEGGPARNSTQIGWRYQLNDQVAWFFNRGEGFKLPSFSALGHPLVGNANLVPETVETFDTGIEWKNETTSFNLSLFENHYKNLIDFDAESFSNVNRPPINSKGVETEIHWQSAHWQVGAHASYAEIDADEPLMGRPEVKAGSNIAYSLNQHWRFQLNYLWVDERFATSLYTGETVRETLNSYDRIDASIAWTINDNIKLHLSGENLGNERYYNDVGFPAVGRAGFAGVDLTF